jgi:hypothetical protein
MHALLAACAAALVGFPYVLKWPFIVETSTVSKIGYRTKGAMMMRIIMSRWWCNAFAEMAFQLRDAL